MKKRILGIFILITLLMTGIPAGAAFIDVQGTKYEKAVQLLCDIGVLEGVSPDYFEPAEQVQRSDAARYIAALSGVAGAEAKEIFSDVPATHPDFGAIYLAYRMGIVSGVGENLFNPDGFVSAAQAAKMLVVLAGYQPHAEAAGGYPSGYLAQAGQLDILKGVSLTEPFTKGELALMMYNTLFVIPAEKASYGDTDGSYVAKGENLLARNLHIDETEGLVTANAATAVRGAALGRGEVAIEGVTYLAPDTLSRKIGRKVIAYYTENEVGEKEVVSFRDAENTNTIELDAKDVLPATSVTAIVYQRSEDAKAVTLPIAEGAVVLYNGSVRVPFAAEDLKPAQGTVYVTEAKSGSASLIVVEAYTDFIIKDVNSEESILYYKDNALEETDLDFADTNVYFHVTDTDGNLFDLQNCTAGMVLSVMESRDEKVCKVVVSADKVSGVITEKTDDVVYIDGKAYAFSASFTGVLPTLGDNVQLSLNYKNEAVGVEKNFSARQYGYLMKGEFEGKGLSKVAKVKLLTAANEIVVHTAAENIKVNDVVVGSDKLFNPDAVLFDEASAEVSKIYQNRTTVEQLIVYEQNDKGEITSITTAEDRTTVFERDRNVFSLQFEAASGMFLGYGLRMFNAKYRVPTDTVVFSVGESYTGYNDEQYKAMTGSALQHSSHYPGLKLYDFNDENEAAAMVTKLDMRDDAGMYESNAVLVKSVSTVATEDGEVCEAVRIVGAGGTEQTLYNPDGVKAVFAATAITKDDPAAVKGELPSHISISQLQPGDVIKYTAVEGNLTNAMVCFRAGSPRELEMAFTGNEREYPSENNDYFPALWVYSQVLYAGENGFRFYATSVKDVPRERIHTYGSATVLIFDRDRQTIRVGNKNSLSKDDWFFASRKNAAEHLIVIYR